MEDSRRLLSEVFERRADYFILTASSEKKLSLNCIKKEKKYMKFVKMTFSCGNYNILRFFSGCLPETRTKDHIHEPRTIENGRLFSNSKQNIYVWNLKLQDYRQEYKSYLQGVLHEDSGKIFKLMTFRRGPRTTYCTVFIHPFIHSFIHLFAINQKYNNSIQKYIKDNI